MSGALNIGIVGGGGWLGSAIAGAISAAKLASPEHLILSYRSEPQKRITGARWTQNNQELADRSDIIIIAVRPDDWHSLAFAAAGKLVVSVMAGIRVDQLARRHGTSRVVRALPNAAAEVGYSYSPWIGSPGIDDHDRSIIRRIFETCGTADEMGSEADIDNLTGLSGSGPAFPALLAAAMMVDARSRGLSPDIARRAANAVLVGAGRLLEFRDQCPCDVVDAFLAYRGTTAQAIDAMRTAGFDAAVAKGLDAALRTSAGMGDNSQRI